MKYGKRSVWRNIVSSPITMVVLFIVFFSLARATWNVYSKSSLSATKLSQAQIELDKLKARQTDLADKVNYLSTEQGIESEIRTKYKGVKAGESVAVIVDDSKSDILGQASTTPTLGWWASWLHRLGL